MDTGVEAAIVEDRAGALSAPSSRRSAELTVVVPTFNERDNVGLLVAALERSLSGIEWEVVFVDDDSPDATASRIREIARADARVRCLHRIGRRGLSTACIEGILTSSAPYVAVMDADFQHDEKLLPQMLAALKYGDSDIIVGSRYVPGGGIGDWDKRRAGISSLATRLSRLVSNVQIADPMSGFFMVRREFFEATVHRLSGRGFKILLDLLASAPQAPRLKELPYQFRTRMFGESKLDTLVAWEFAMLLADKLVGHRIPVRFVLFAAIGGLGVVIHLLVLALSLSGLGLAFIAAQSLATFVAMTSNFFVNNTLTYRDRRIKGRALIKGLFSFYLICSVGAVANIGVASYLFAAKEVWWVAGFAGIVISSAWNYAASSVFTWSDAK